MEKARERFHAIMSDDTLYRRSMMRNIGITYMMEGRYNEALHWFNKSSDLARIEKQPVTELRNNMCIGRCLTEQHQFSEALNELSQAEKLWKSIFPDSSINNLAWPGYYAGIALVRKGNLSGAKEKVEEIKSFIASNKHYKLYSWMYHALMAEIYTAELDQGLASSEMKAVVPGNRWVFPRCRMLRAAISIQQGEMKKAEQIYDFTYNFEQAMREFNGGDLFDFFIERSKLDYYRGQMYEHFGDRVNAIKYYEKALYNWRNADKDYVNLLDAKDHLAKLKGR